MQMKIGQIETDGILGRRDSFHVPAILVTSDETRLKPGGNVRFVDDDYTSVVKCKKGEVRHGIIDPFVPKIKTGQMFWVLLVPEAVTSLVHHFVPNFTDVPIKYVPPPIYDDEYSEGNRCSGCW